jgi:peptide/nickel transport system ATP-binding protein
MALATGYPGRMAGAPLLVVDELVTEFRTERGTLRAVDGVSFTVAAGQTVGVVGESGSGKSVTALSILRLLPEPAGRIVSGRIVFDGQELSRASEKELRRLRGDRIAMIFQEPMTSLNPVITGGEQVAEVLRVHRGLGRAAARQKAIELFAQVGIPAPELRVRSYPHELSGGMRQRVMIAMALACDPALLIADEPTTALDVTIQAQILELLARLQRERGMAILLISHDLAVIAETCEAIVVMYGGEVVERGLTADVLAAPRHPYTRALLASRVPDMPVPGARRTALPVLSEPRALPDGPRCGFASRCPDATELCEHTPPALTLAGDRAYRCHHPLGLPA